MFGGSIKISAPTITTNCDPTFIAAAFKKTLSCTPVADLPFLAPNPARGASLNFPASTLSSEFPILGVMLTFENPAFTESLLTISLFFRLSNLASVFL